MGTSKKSTGTRLNDPMLFAVDTLVSLSAKQENDAVKTTPDTCGRGFERPLADYDRDTQSWRMFGDTYLWGESPLLENLPVSGMTRNGDLYQRPAWELRICANESLLWPTPTAVVRPKAKLGRWPTPVASDAWTDGLKSSQQKEGSRHSMNLPSAIGGKLNPMWVEWLMGFPTGWTDLEGLETP
jgi:hypothetical protein